MKKIIFVLSLICSLSASAQEEKKEEGKFTLSGSVDTYYATNLSTPSLGTTGVLSDVTSNGFGLGMANTVFSYEKGKAGVVADLAFGPRANAANAYTGAINQLYAYYQATESIKITLGQFNTFYGYEVISPVTNFNYTVSYLFNAGPFSHTGMKIDYAASEELSFMIALTNPHGIVDGANTSSDAYQFGFQTGYKNQYINLAYGSDGFGFKDVLYLDYTGGLDLSDIFYVGINAAYANSNDADAGYQGAALYLQKQFSDSFSLGFRSEFFKTTSSAEDANVSAFTLTGSNTLTENLKLITELRYDTSKDRILIGGKNSVTGLVIAAVYTF
jgi:hypothetical protein